MKLLKMLGKLLVLAVMAGGIYYAIHMTQVTTEHRGPIKDLRIKVENATEYKPGDTVEVLDFDVTITDVTFTPLNPQTTEIVEGDEYYIEYTIHVGNNSDSPQSFKKIGIGSTMSVAFDYEDYYLGELTDLDTPIAPGTQGAYRFRVKTDEPVTKLGFMISYALADKNAQNKILFK